MARHDLSIVPVHRTTPPDESVLQTPLPAIPPEHDIKSEEEFSQLDPQPQVEKRWHFTRNQASSRDEGILPGDVLQITLLLKVRPLTSCCSILGQRWKTSL